MKGRQIIKLIMKTVAWLIILVAFCGMAYSFIAKNVKDDKMPMPFGIGTSLVLSGSMEPEISINDLVVIKRCKDYQVGDVVVYQWGSSCVIHRIVEKDGDMVVTQGDANNTPDKPISLRDIKGKKIAVIAGAAKVVDFIKSPIVIALFVIGIIIVLGVLSEKDKNNYGGESDALYKEFNNLHSKATRKT